MLTKVPFLKKISPIPFALYKNKVCIFEYEINDTIFLNTISEKLWDRNTSKTVNILKLSSDIVAATKFSVNDAEYMFAVTEEEQSRLDKQLINMQKYVEIGVDFLKSDKMTSDLINLPQNLNRRNIENNFNQDFKMYNIENKFQLEEIAMHELVRGNKQNVQILFNKIINLSNTPLSKDKLTSQKYRIIILLTLVSRTCIRKNCPVGITLRLTDKLTIQLDRIQSSDDIQLFIEHIAVEYYSLLKNNAKNYNSKCINDAVEFINVNIYKPINNDTISDYLDMNPSYLSSLFKHETGTPLRTFIINKKVSESKYLLRNTSMSINAIASALNFSNQSHFSKSFKERTGFTPKYYQDVVNSK
ncbi:AraC family transcriptional regulator [Companilactobacillus baiquanensis]|uniref:Helix-turn-helix domain-containing protein n=1 Tax=Companilactobacillus baiquanensis TaxID=2486005 RepID=A0ABW1UYL6_9LACO|nr:AraC family transcriptional regulator [Companilactobacillus baiquanensis]